MSLGRTEWPENGEMVIATVSRLESYGAYVNLDEYNNKEALLHISEISSRWVRNIRNHVRENQKVVLQVLRVDASKGQVDLSLRRVNKDDKRKKVEQWKKTRKAETLLKQAAIELKVTPEDLYAEIIPKLNEAQLVLYDAFEESAKKGEKIFLDAGIKTKIADALARIAKEKIIVKGVTVQGVFEFTSMSSRGVEEIKEAFKALKELGEENEAEVNIYTLGAPKYRIEITSEDYKKAEFALDKIVKKAEKEWANQDGITLSFKRE
jgi:translation initiation factor 2 subunit 1